MQYGLIEKTTDKNKSGSQIDDEVESDSTEDLDSNNGLELEEDEVVDAENSRRQSFLSTSKQL